jgi:hypothetical protein
MLNKAKVEACESMDIITLNDVHVPFEDKRALSVAFKFCEIIQPEIILMHEWHDFYAISKFSKDPKRVNSLQEELDMVRGYWEHLSEICPNSQKVLLKSNHMDRLQKYMWRHAKAFAYLRDLQLNKLLKLDELGIAYMDSFEIGDEFIAKHGKNFRKHSAYTCRAEFEKEGISGASAHTHRLGKFYATKRSGDYEWMETGCLCKMQQDYIEGVPNWQHGLGHIRIIGNKDIRQREIPIRDYKLIYRDKIIKA